MARHAPRGPVKARHPMDAGHPMDARPDVRCSATNRAGNQCGRRPIPGGTVCVMHGGKAPQVKAAAQKRLDELRPAAIQYLDWLLTQREFPSAGLGAARDVLDRNDGKPRESVAVEHSGGIDVRWEGE